ncbi:hypothetical protein I5M27_18450 [Adhaeribacter sp. BT258]|uniref:RiboL-PSP-HEPN domain-containing protein n=1 Tax=Adhaeribacter terrigena TaxID=2793070 RepID=A0ABS1C6G9_9BACT|nr:hypothetical protein [Adhaeribacter terrigena]MBK0404972.1 hypothetical protein [Adhaeribacter terrigena]
MERYETAIEEYEAEPEGSKEKIIYAYFGLAIYFSQSLEETFSIMLWTDRIFKKKVKTNKEVNDIIDAIENSKRTLGNFINEVKHSYNLPNKLETELTEILEKRNYLVHKYFKLEIQKFFSELGKREMIKYFCDFIDDCQRIDRELKSYYSHYTTKMGLSDERIEQIMNEMKEEELLREKTVTNNS